MIFNIVFFISVTSVLVQGTTLPIFARWLNVALPREKTKASEPSRVMLDIPKSSMRKFEILPDADAANKRIVELDFPSSAHIMMIERDGEYIVPKGSVQIEAGDVLTVVANKKEDFEEVQKCLGKANSMINPE
jgi:cell volume regulation protein A